jgi:hypothetical protein
MNIQNFAKAYLLTPFLLAFAFAAQAQYDVAQDRLMRNGAAQVLTLSKNGVNYGHAVFISRDSNKIKAKYFAKNAYSAFLNWKTGKNIVMISSGAYSTGWDASKDTPVGLCVDNGVTVNRNIEDKMDGLVIVEAVGGVRVSDIDNDDLYLQSMNKTVSPRTDKFTLMKWGEDEQATIFQTHLLAYKDGIRVGASNSSSNSAARRMLVLGFIQGKLFHAVFHITQNVTLYDATNDIMKTLKNWNVTVSSILNLDTGGYNIFEVYDDNNQKIPYINGDKDKSIATNLLIYYYE